MYYFIFSFVVLIAIILGSLAGIGGGVIIRPALDAFNYFENLLKEYLHNLYIIIVIVIVFCLGIL